MAISIDATVGGASANSYLTLGDANAIIDGLVQDDDKLLGRLLRPIRRIVHCSLQRSG
jgi:flavorubredoxin